MEPVLIVGIIIAGIGALATAFGSVLIFLASRQRNRVAELGGYLGLNQYIDKRVDALVEERIGDVRDRLREAERRANVFVRIVRSLALQWPANAAPPVLDPSLVEQAEDALPSHWIPNGSEPTKERDSHE